MRTLFLVLLLSGVINTLLGQDIFVKEIKVVNLAWGMGATATEAVTNSRMSGNWVTANFLLFSDESYRIEATETDPNLERVSFTIIYDGTGSAYLENFSSGSSYFISKAFGVDVKSYKNNSEIMLTFFAKEYGYIAVFLQSQFYAN